MLFFSLLLPFFFFKFLWAEQEALSLKEADKTWNDGDRQKGGREEGHKQLDLSVMTKEGDAR